MDNPKPPRQYASLNCLDDNGAPLSPNSSTSCAKTIAHINKCLDEARNPDTPEDEAIAALQLCSRLITHHNVTLTTLNETNSIHYLNNTAVGSSVVSILTTLPSDRVIDETWVRIVCDALSTHFDCKAYSTKRGTSLEWTFCGIQINAVTAAITFEMINLLVTKWSSGRGGSKNSYKLGVATCLRNNASREKEKETLHAKKQESQDEEDSANTTQDGPAHQYLGRYSSAQVNPEGNISDAVQATSISPAVQHAAYAMMGDLNLDHQFSMWPSEAALMKYRHTVEQAVDRHFEINNIRTIDRLQRPVERLGDPDYNDGMADGRKFNLRR